ncbi:MAG: hypothetical protein JWM00_260 [Candidatus Saccharibacteria bacterium]|nr:hypothetical protein [Candidatus Saccharibacteria bacterium]
MSEYDSASYELDTEPTLDRREICVALRRLDIDVDFEIGMALMTMMYWVIS